MLSDIESKNLGKAIADLVADRGLGAIAKKDYELLVFHYISSARSQQKDDNYTLSNKLKITGARVKTLRLEAAPRHDPPDHAKTLKTIINRIVTQIKGSQGEGKNLVISLENPIEKREFEHALRRVHHAVEYGINRDLLKISPLALFDVILAKIDDPETKFKEVVQKIISDKNAQTIFSVKRLHFAKRSTSLARR